MRSVIFHEIAYDKLWMWKPKLINSLKYEIFESFIDISIFLPLLDIVTVYELALAKHKTNINNLT